MGKLRHKQDADRQGSALSDYAKIFRFIFLICLLGIPCLKKTNWPEDSQPPHQGQAAWQPHRKYSPDIEEGLFILAGTDPAEVAYFRARGYPVVFVPGVPGRLGETTTLGVIEIPRRFEGQPAQLAVVLSHEIVHEQRHDPFVMPTKYPVWRRVLWHQEEEVAHNKDLWVALKLLPRHPSVLETLGTQWIFEFFLYPLVAPQFIIAAIYLLILANRARKTFASWLALRISQSLAVVWLAE